MSGSKFRTCFPCIPAKKQTPDPNVTVVPTDDPDAFFWQDGVQVYSKKQVCKAVAIVLSGYDSGQAACSIDPTLDSSTVDIWVQLYRPLFFEDGMACPPALISWWMDEIDRKRNLAQGQGQIGQTAGVGQPFYGNPTQNIGPGQNFGPTQNFGPGQNLGPTQNFGPTQNLGPAQILGPTPNSTVPFQSSNVYGTSYMKVPIVTPDGTVINQTVTRPNSGSGAAGNSIVISSPSASQPNIRLVYQDQNGQITGTGSYVSGQNQSSQQVAQQQLQAQQQQVAQQQITQQQAAQQQRPSSSPPAIFNSYGSAVQQQYIAMLQQKQAEDALKALQAQAAQNQGLQGQGQQGQGQQGRFSRGGGPGGPPYNVN